MTSGNAGSGMITSMHRLLGGVVAALLLTGCGNAGSPASEDSADPERFARLQAYVRAALERSSELDDPTTVAEANRHYGFTGDNPLRVEQWTDDAEGFAYCVANRVEGTYYAVTYRDATREWLGDGDCSTDRADAAVVYDGTDGHYVTGGDLMVHVGDIRVPPPTRGPQADLEDVGTSLLELAEALDAQVRKTGRAPDEVDAEALGVDLREGQQVTGYRVSDGGGAYAFCLVHEPSGAWGLYDSTASLAGETGGGGALLGVGRSGATCKPDPESLLGE